MRDQNLSDAGNGINAESGGWTFDIPSADAFSEHISLSVPSYKESHEVISDISDFYIHDNSKVFDIGCSLGDLIKKLSLKHANKRDVEFIGIESSEQMASHAKDRLTDYPVKIIHGNALEQDFSTCSFAVLHYMLQFISKSNRLRLVQNLYNGLEEGGAILIFEKVRCSDPEIYDMLLSSYDMFKRRSGFTPDQIDMKRQSLKGVLRPNTTEENIAMIKGAGFRTVTLIHRHYLFEGYIGIK